MATIRDVVEALSRSNGVDAVVVVGRDGLPIDSRVANGVDADSVAREPDDRRPAARSPSPRWVGARLAARTAQRGRHRQPSGPRPHRRRRGSRAARSPAARCGAGDEAVQPDETQPAHRDDVRRRRAGGAVSTWAAILAGGSGTRFWPLSTPERPKQFLPLISDRPLLAQTVARLHGLVPPERMLILTGPSLVDRVAATVPEIPHANIFAEPRAASTAPALAWAAHWIAKHDPGGEMLSLHADLAVGDDAAFRAPAAHALAVAVEQDVLVTVGIKATRDETRYGYIVPGGAAWLP